MHPGVIKMIFSFLKKKEPENLYLVISEKSAWQLLRKWMTIPENLAYYSFRSACGMEPCKTYENFFQYSKITSWNIDDLIPDSRKKKIYPLDLSIGSTFIGNFSNYIGSEVLNEKISRKVKEENLFLVGGYGEVRPFYTTDAYKIPTNEGYEHRTIHIGIDFWIDAQTPIYALESGEIYGCYNNDNPKDYGPTLILKHHVSGGLTFYTLHGHLTKQSLKDKFIGKTIHKGEKLGEF